MAEFLIPSLGKYEWQKTVLSKSLSVPPASPIKGDRYIAGSSPSGAWSGQEGNIAFFDGSIWKFTDKFEGMAVYVKDEKQYYIFITSWLPYLVKPRVYNVVGNTNVSTNSSSFVDIPNMIISGVPIPGNSFISFSATITGANREVRILIDGNQRVIGLTTGTAHLTLQWCENFSEVFHEVKIQWRRTASGTVTQTGTTYNRILSIILGFNGSLGAVAGSGNF